MTAFDRNQAYCPFNNGVRDANDSLRECFDIAKISFAPFQFAAGSLQIQSESTVQQSAAAKMTEHGMRVGNGGQFSAAITDRPGIRSCAFRPHAQRATCVDPRDRAAACPNCVNFEHGNRNRKPRDLRLPRDLSFPGKQCDIG